ncbi:hypothetical protein JCM33374_g5216 [Metschnikowia sp. JCM 33374]|nr:hypothetical protein JCM33374_g5216 [Metschnikowia sp. JCM 33374]
MSYYGSGYASQEDYVDVYQFEEEIIDHTEEIYCSPIRRANDFSDIQILEDHMNRVFTRRNILFCIDVEAWEHNQEYVTEIGVSIYDPRPQKLALTPDIKTYHILINDNRDVKNGNFVPDHSSNFSGGTTHILSLKQSRALLQGLINHYFVEPHVPNCILVGHDLRGDIKWLNKLGVSIASDVRKLDTQTLFSYTHGLAGASLQNALRTVNQPFAFLHNAGNDAYYTIMLALKLCDPKVRRLTGIDFFKDGEARGKPRYKKAATNKSKFSTASVNGLLNQIIG